jgi:hypothetical protein
VSVDALWMQQASTSGATGAGRDRVPARVVLIDATIIRGVLLPATMKLLGDWNWYLPCRLEWLPRLSPAPRRAPTGGMEPAFDASFSDRSQ